MTSSVWALLTAGEPSTVWITSCSHTLETRPQHRLHPDLPQRHQQQMWLHDIVASDCSESTVVLDFYPGSDVGSSSFDLWIIFWVIKTFLSSMDMLTLKSELEENKMDQLLTGKSRVWVKHWLRNKKELLLTNIRIKKVVIYFLRSCFGPRPPSTPKTVWNYQFFSCLNQLMTHTGASQYKSTIELI